MDNLVVNLENLRKDYKVYPSQLHRLLEFFLGGSKKLHKTFTALNNVSLQIKKGEIVGLIGKNGAGKSTLLKLIAGLSPVTKGRIEVKGRVAAILSLGLGFHPEYTGLENIKINAAILGIEKEHLNKKIKEIADFAEIGDFINQPVKNYSTGMEARLAFAILTALDADTFLIDEVLAVGDLYFVDKCLNYIRSLRERGKTALLVSHNIYLLQTLCQRIIWLDKGEIKMVGEPLNVCAKYGEFIKEEEEVKLLADQQKLPVERKDKAISINQIKILNKTGKESAIFNTGDSMRVRIEFTAREKVLNPGFSIAVTRQDGILIFFSYTGDLKINLGEFLGKSSVKVHIDNLFLESGNYFLSVYIYPPRYNENPIVVVNDYDRRENVAFRILRKGRTGGMIFNQPLKWQHSK